MTQLLGICSMEKTDKDGNLLDKNGLPVMVIVCLHCRKNGGTLLKYLFGVDKKYFHKECLKKWLIVNNK